MRMFTIFITGASSGIGQALAKCFAQQYREQAVIGLLARRAQPLAEFADALQQTFHCQTAWYACDVRNAEAVAKATEGFLKQHGAPNLVIANAGVSSGTLTESIDDLQAFQSVMDINVMGMVNTFHPFIAAMKIAAAKGKPAQFAGIASVAGIRGLPGAGAYSASKAAAIAYLESLRTEMQHHGIAVTTIAPGYIRTPMTAINPYKMPFLMEADTFALKAFHALARKKRYVVIPWQMGIVAKILRLIPDWLWDLLTRNAPHKPRIDL